MGRLFSRSKPDWSDRAAVADFAAELATPTLVVHGRHDPFFPVGNGEALAREIPGAQLLVLEQAATAIPAAAAGEVAAAMLAL
jgi:pimeloyl-ACP methyl ester carboxylesterase